MREPDPDFERKVLRDVVEQMEDPADTYRKQVLLRRALIALGVSGLVAGFFVAINELAHPFVAAVVTAIAGTALGFGLFLELAHRQWPITRKHIDMSSVRKRLDELGT